MRCDDGMSIFALLSNTRSKLGRKAAGQSQSGNPSDLFPLVTCTSVDARFSRARAGRGSCQSVSAVVGLADHFFGVPELGAARS